MRRSDLAHVSVDVIDRGEAAALGEDVDGLGLGQAGLGKDHGAGLGVAAEPAFGRMPGLDDPQEILGGQAQEAG